MSQVIGATQLISRLERLGNPSAGRTIMAKLAINATALMKKNVARRSGMTGASIRPLTVTAQAAVIKVGGAGKWLEQGTGIYGPHHTRVVPRQAKVMVFMGGPTSAFRLSGTVRSGKAGAAAYKVFARSTQGMNKQPFIRKSLIEAAAGVGLKEVVIVLWDSGGIVV